MTLLEELDAHKGGLIRLKGELYWYGGRGWDGIRGRVCLLMDARDAAGPVALSGANIAAAHPAPAAPGAHAAPAAAAAHAAPAAAAAFLLVDGEPHWVWVSSDDLELL